MIFFKPMADTENNNWKKSAIIGFYTYLIILFIDQSYYIFNEKSLISSVVIFWIGLIVVFTSNFILNVLAKRNKDSMRMSKNPRE
ncbi:hypothetical protein [Oceanobacillus sp. CAU 1775]